ncbi:MAG: hypothetical protein K8T20_05395 [Planctomycetes bacterium]|nr:hypothetical protein [Planctomycetota bacterium]
MRAILFILSASLPPLFLAGCASKLVDSAELATHARGLKNVPADTLRGFAQAGKRIEGDEEKDLKARYLLAAIYYEFHGLGAPASFPPGDPDFAWAVEKLRASGKRDFLELAFHQVWTLEELTFTVDGIPPWATVDRLLIAADEILAREDSLVAQLPPDTIVQGASPAFADAQMRLAILDVVRGFCVQAWRRALDADESAEPSRERLARVYRDMGAAWEKLAAEPGVPAVARQAYVEQQALAVGRAQRVAIVISPEDLNHSVEREMLKLVAKDHLVEGRRLAMQGFMEKQAGNRPRAAGYLRGSMSHFVLALAIGVEDEGEQRSVLGFLRDLVLGLRGVER